MIRVAGAVLLGGSWVVISGLISRVTVVITHIKGLITPLITTHEPPSTPAQAPVTLEPQVPATRSHQAKKLLDPYGIPCLLVGYHGEPKVNLFHSIRII